MVFLINATIGLSVLLPCIIPPPPPPLKDTRIYWQTVEKGNNRDTLVLHFYNFGKEEHHHAANKYKNRTALDLSQLPLGNFSLELKNVTKEDNQTTINCLYSKGGEIPKEIDRITLMVLNKPKEPVEVPVSTPTRTRLGLLIGLLLLTFALLLICGGVCTVTVRRKRTGCMAVTGTEASLEEGTGLDKQTVNGAAHGEEDKEQQNDILMRNDHG